MNSITPAREFQFSSRKIVCGALFLLIAVRMAIILTTAPDQQMLFPAESPYRGAMALEMMKRGGAINWNLRPDDYAGGSWVVAGLAALFFNFMGPTILALKCVSLLFAVLGLLFWFKAIEISWGKGAASIFSILYIFAPPAFLDYTLTPIGDHAETIFFTSVLVFSAAKMSINPKSLIWTSLLAGIALGFGTWYAYITAIGLLVFLIWLSLSCFDAIKLRVGVLVVAGFAIGFAPWIGLNLYSHFIGLKIQGGFFWEHFDFSHFVSIFPDGQRFFRGGLNSLASTLPWSQFTKKTLNLLYAGIFSGPVLLFILCKLTSTDSQREAKVKASKNFILFILLYAALFALFYIGSNFRGSRYFIPLYPFVFAMVALAAWRTHRHFRSLVYAVLSISIAVCLVIQIARARDLGSAIHLKSYSYAWIAQSPVCSQPELCLVTVNQLIDELLDGDRHVIYYHVSERLVTEFVPEDLKNEMPNYLQAEKSLSYYYAYALGNLVFVYESHGSFKPSEFHDSWNRFIADHREAYQLGLLRGLGESDQGWTQIYQVSCLQDVLPEDIDEAWGIIQYDSSDEPTGSLRKVLDPMPGSDRSHYLRGAGFSLYRREPKKVNRSIENLKVNFEEKQSIWNGVGSAVLQDYLWSPLPQWTLPLRRLYSKLNAQDRGAFKRGTFQELNRLETAGLVTEAYGAELKGLIDSALR